LQPETTAGIPATVGNSDADNAGPAVEHRDGFSSLRGLLRRRPTVLPLHRVKHCDGEIGTVVFVHKSVVGGAQQEQVNPFADEVDPITRGERSAAGVPAK
jgi:hypothetical protein